MNRRTTLAQSAMTVLCLIVAAPGVASGQSAKDLVGTWTLVSTDTVRPDGGRIPTFGDTPNGLIVFTSDGHFIYLYSRGDLPKFVSNNRTTGTPEENRAVVQGSIAYFGTYSVNDRVINVHIEGSTFPNWEGADQKRLFAVSGDELRIINPTPSIGWGTAQVIWKRAK